MTNYFVGVRRPGTAVRDIQDILTDMDEVAGYGDSQANVRRLIAEFNFVVPPGLTAGTYWVAKDGTLQDTSATAAFIPLAILHLDPASYSLTGKNLGLIIRASAGGNDAANAAGDSVGVQLNAVQFFGASAGGLIASIGGVVIGCGPSCSFGRDEQSTVFPAAGFYGIVANITPSVPAGHRITVNAQILRYQDSTTP